MLQHLLELSVIPSLFKNFLTDKVVLPEGHTSADHIGVLLHVDHCVIIKPAEPGRLQYLHLQHDHEVSESFQEQSGNPVIQIL
jgi:hypothetical protein